MRHCTVCNLLEADFDIAQEHAIYTRPRGQGAAYEDDYAMFKAATDRLKAAKAAFVRHRATHRMTVH
jgi:hypothetical protein